MLGRSPRDALRQYLPESCRGCQGRGQVPGLRRRRKMRLDSRSGDVLNGLGKLRLMNSDFERSDKRPGGTGSK